MHIAVLCTEDAQSQASAELQSDAERARASVFVDRLDGSRSAQEAAAVAATSAARFARLILWISSRLPKSESWSSCAISRKEGGVVSSGTPSWLGLRDQKRYGRYHATSMNGQLGPRPAESGGVGG